MRERIIELARACLGQGGPEPWASEAGFKIGPSDKPSWCGLFVRAIWRRAGLTLPDWRMGEGNVHYLRKLGPGERAKMGDLGYIELHGHQCIVVEDDGRVVRSIDGNSMGARVVERLRPRSDYAAFYSIGGLLTDDTPTEPAQRTPTVLSSTPVQGEAARRVQAALVARGARLTVDGKAGPRTLQALVDWAWGELIR